MLAFGGGLCSLSTSSFVNISTTLFIVQCFTYFWICRLPLRAWDRCLISDNGEVTNGRVFLGAHVLHTNGRCHPSGVAK